MNSKQLAVLLRSIEHDFKIELEIAEEKLKPICGKKIKALMGGTLTVVEELYGIQSSMVRLAEHIDSLEGDKN